MLVQSKYQIYECFHACIDSSMNFLACVKAINQPFYINADHYHANKQKQKLTRILFYFSKLQQLRNKGSMYNYLMI